MDPQKSEARRGARRRTMEGFTLIEVMMVVVIIGILLTIMINKFRGRDQIAREVAAAAHIQAIGNALDMYELDNGFYPTTQQGMEALLRKPGGAPEPLNWRQPYLEKLPLDPWGSPYSYQQPGNNNSYSYDLWSNGADRASGTADDINNWD